MYFIEDLLEECNKVLMEYEPGSDGIRQRQLFNDIRFMESEAGWSVPLGRYRFGKRTYYRYEDPSFSINNQPLNDSETEQLRAALQILSRFSGTPHFEWVNEMIPLLESKLGLIERKGEVMSFEANVDLKGLHHLTPLFNAIINKRVLLVEYKSFRNSSPITITFHPYYLKQYNNRWFAFGYNPEAGVFNWNLALDRIESLQETDLKYTPSAIEWEEYFYDIIGVTKPTGVEVQEVVLQFSTDIAPYVTTKPLHPSQKQKNNDQDLEVRIRVIPNYELEQLILSFGEKVKVLGPPGLKARIARRLQQATGLYEGSTE